MVTIVIDGNSLIALIVFIFGLSLAIISFFHRIIKGNEVELTKCQGEIKRIDEQNKLLFSLVPNAQETLKKIQQIMSGVDESDNLKREDVIQLIDEKVQEFGNTKKLDNWLLSLTRNARENLEKIQKISNDINASNNLSREDATKLFENLIQELNLPTNLDNPPEQWKSALFNELSSKLKEKEFENPEILLIKGNGEYFATNYTEANKLYETAVKIKPDFLEAWYNLGLSQGSLGKLTKNESLLQKSIEKFKKAIEIKHDFLEAWCDWGNSLGNLGELTKDELLFNDAFEKYKQAIKINSDYEVVWHNWGIHLVKLGEQTQDASLYRDACKKFKQAIKIKPDFYKAWSGWGYALVNLSYLVEEKERETILNEALVKCLEAEKFKPGAGAYNLSCLYSIKNDVDNALEWFTKGFELRADMKSREYIDNDRDLDNIREDPRFIEILDKYRPKK